MADDYDEGPSSQNSFGLATNPLMPMGDPLAYARMGASPDQAMPVDRMFSMQAQPYESRVQSQMPGLVSNVEIPQKKSSGEASNPLQAQAPQATDAGTNQLGGLGQLLQLQGLHDMVRPQAAAPETPAETPAASPTSFGAGKAIAGTSPVSAGQYQDAVNTAAQKWGVDPKLLTSQLFHESGFNKDAVSPAGAKGIGQFMPATAKQYGIDPKDPNQSIDAAAHMMSDLQKKYGGNTQLALMGYNWGQANVDKWLQGKGWQVPKETQDYVKRITGQDIMKPNLANDINNLGNSISKLHGVLQGVSPDGKLRDEGPTMQSPQQNQQQQQIPTFGGLPNRSAFTPGSLAEVLKQPPESIAPAGTRENAIGQAKNIFNAQEGAKMDVRPAQSSQQQAPQKQTAQAYQGMNFNQMNPQMQQLWKYMLLQSLFPRIQFKNINYDPWAVHRFGQGGGY